MSLGGSHGTVVPVNFEPHIVVVADRNAFPQQPALFPADSVSGPPGFRYQAEFLSIDEEDSLARWIETLPLEPFAFRGYLGNRRVLSFGHGYDDMRRAGDTAAALPQQLAPIIERAAHWSGHKPGDFRQVMISEYAPGAPIGWHADKPQFGDVAGISLLAPAPFRLRRPIKDGWERKTVRLAPGSIYLMSGEVRTSWQHSIPPLTALRYSITLRTLADGVARRAGKEQSTP